MMRASCGHVLAIATLVLASCGDDEPTRKTKGGLEETFKNPPLLQPNADGVYVLEFDAYEQVIDGTRHCVRAYNGMYPGPTIDIAARQGNAQRQVRVDLVNRFSQPEYLSLDGEQCDCADQVTGMSCVPDHGWEYCECTNSAGDVCHMFDFNETNLHAHGSHVRPDFATGGGCEEDGKTLCRPCMDNDVPNAARDCFFADDVLSRVHHGETAQHRWDLDEDETHHTGTQWYHPHIHGTTSMQVASGSAGALIVRGELDELDGIKNARERIMVFSTPPIGDGGFAELEEGQDCSEDTVTFDNFATLESVEALQRNIINGMRRPRMLMAPGQIERWRIIHAGYVDEAFMAVFHGNDPDCSSVDTTRAVPLTQIARDGLTMPKPADGEGWPFAPDWWFMSAGYRVDSILDGNAFQDGDTLCFVIARPLQDDYGTVGQETIVGQSSLLEDEPDIVELLQIEGDVAAIINVTSDAGPATETRPPDYEEVAKTAPSLMLDGVDALARCATAQAETDLTQIDQVMNFQVGPTTGGEGFDNCGCSDHNINCRNFEDTDREAYPFDRVLTKDAVEHWRLFSYFDGHPFHIHINPFLVCPLPPEGSDDPNVKTRLFEPPFAHWRDTYLLNLDRTADVLMQYKTHTGPFVLHCHKLLHEDHGMMELIKVCDPAVESCDTLCSGGECGWDQCAAGDDQCVKEYYATLCVSDPMYCPDAGLRCTACDDQACPPGSYCDDQVGKDGSVRCVPGCQVDTDCPLTDACQPDNTCAPAPCMPMCLPMQMCVHGACT